MNRNFVDALEQFKKAAYAVYNVWQESENNDDDRCEEKYPFDKSLDEVANDILQWYETQEEYYKIPTMQQIANEYKKLNGINLGWHDENTGGHTMVYYKDFTCKDGITRLIGLNEESLSLYDVDYETMYKDECDLCNHELFGVNFETCSETTLSITCKLKDLSKWLTDDQIETVKHGFYQYLGEYWAD